MLWTYCSFLSVQNIQVNTVVFGYSSVDEGKRRHTLYKTILFYAHLKIVVIRNHGSWNNNFATIVFVVHLYTYLQYQC